MIIQKPDDVSRVAYRARAHCATTHKNAVDGGLNELAANVVARRVADLSGDLGPWFDPSLKRLPNPGTLPDGAVAATRLAKAVMQGECIGLCTDYDVDGITAHTLIREALTLNFGHPEALVRPFIGHRLLDGYGLSDNLCERILGDDVRPDLVITADCGSSDGPRIEKLKSAGIEVIVTDHHGIPSSGVPAHALATVNPSRADSAFADPAIAGCAVAWFLMALVRTELIRAGHLGDDAPKLARSLDLVALGTVADAVSLFSPTNRSVVTAGLSILNQRQRPCWHALADLLKRGNKKFEVDDLGFQIGPRINARGRVADPLAALNFLTAPDRATAARYLNVLDEDNQSRREIEKRMVETARDLAERELKPDTQVVCVYHEDFHPGVQGIVASRLLDRFGRVTAVMSPAGRDNLVSGSLRSIPGVDVGRALREVNVAHDGLLHRFGGHPMAAGVSVALDKLDTFRDALALSVREQLGAKKLNPVLWHDGALTPDQLHIDSIHELDRLIPFGRGFEPPTFHGEFLVDAVRAVGADPVHLSLTLNQDGRACRAIWFRALGQAGEAWPVAVGDQVEALFRLQRDDYRGGDAIQLVVEHARAL
ncbi:MAG: DHH family phosphoesterase [Gammaproteobacteria bacterium]